MHPQEALTEATARFWEGDDGAVQVRRGWHRRKRWDGIASRQGSESECRDETASAVHETPRSTSLHHYAERDAHPADPLVTPRTQRRSMTRIIPPTALARLAEDVGLPEGGSDVAAPDCAIYQGDALGLSGAFCTSRRSGRSANANNPQHFAQGGNDRRALQVNGHDRHLRMRPGRGEHDIARTPAPDGLRDQRLGQWD